jgi:5-oxopent-3-ene-1,2,5-tricarboxylate decarboxylase / 2-hydroxyhepta-2,4-diene-1,7-dioate isomerase
MLMLGCDVERPRVRAGDRVEIKMPALGTLTNTFVAEAA